MHCIMTVHLKSNSSLCFVTLSNASNLVKNNPVRFVKQFSILYLICGTKLRSVFDILHRYIVIGLRVTFAHTRCSTALTLSLPERMMGSSNSSAVLSHSAIRYS